MTNQNPELIWNSPRPWTKEQIILSTFKDFQKTLKAINLLPGGVIASELEAVHLSFNIFLDATYDLLKSINAFKGESARPGFWDRTRRADFERLELHIQRGVFSAAMAAMALVDHSRIFIGKYPVKLYSERVKQCFSEDPLHRFVQNFRNFMTHVHIAKSDWTVKHNKQGRSVFFFLTRENLNKWDGWDFPAKSYIASKLDGVNVEELFDKYSDNVKAFHNWFRSQVWQEYSEVLTEFFDCKKTYNVTHLRSQWRLLIEQIFLPKKIDPYIYLDRYLSDIEMEEILSLPFRSKSQVDRIITFVDVYGACDEELRRSVYALFGVDL